MAPWREHPTTNDLLRFSGRCVKHASEQDAWISAHLEECAFCSDILAEMAAFEEVLPDVDENALRLETASLVRRALETPTAGPRVIPMELVHTSDTDEHWFASSLPLAARSTTARRPVTHLSTLRSKDGRIYLRLLRDSTSGAVLAHLICQQPEAGKQVLLSLNSPETVALTDDNGFARFALSDLPTDDTALVSIHPPAGTCTVSAEHLRALRSRGTMDLPGCTLRFERAEGADEECVLLSPATGVVAIVILLPPSGPVKMLRLPARLRMADLAQDTVVKTFLLPV